MKKILIVHNKYLNLGGEDLVVLNETELLKKKYDVRTIYFHNTKKLEIFDYLSLLLGVNFKSLNVLKKEIKEFNPDIVYFHNLWYKINTKTVLKACKDVKQVLVKQHNLRQINMLKPTKIIKRGNNENDQFFNDLSKRPSGVGKLLFALKANRENKRKISQ